MSTQPLRIVVVGREGQVARAMLQALTQPEFDVVSVARPEADLLRPESVVRAIAGLRPAVVINAAAYTLVDRAEDEPDLAFAINSEGAGAVARAAAEAGAAVIHFSTDYVFDGLKPSAYLETDQTGPLGVYGQSKLSGERQVAAANPRHVILRTSWVCSPFASNFVKTMLRLAGERPGLRVVDDQHGSPTFACDIAHAVRTMAPALASAAFDSEKFGTFHISNAGVTTWCGFARAIMAMADQRGGSSVPVEAIVSADYPSKVRRPANSILATDKLRAIYGISLPAWQTSLGACLDELLGPSSNR